MTKLVGYVLLGWTQFLLYAEGARKEQTGMLPGSQEQMQMLSTSQEEPTSLRRKMKVSLTWPKTQLTQVRMKAKNDRQVDTDTVAKVSSWQDPSMPMHSVNAITTAVPGHRPRAFVVAGISIVLMGMLGAAIFATIHRKVSEEVGATLPLPPLLAHQTSPDFDVKTRRAQGPGDLRSVKDEIAELTKDLTPPSSPEVLQPDVGAKPGASVERSLETAVTPERCNEAESSDFPTTPINATLIDRVHPSLGEAPLPTPPPRSPPKGSRRKRCKVDQKNDVTDPATPQKIETTVALDLRSLDDEFAELTRDLSLQSSSSSSTPFLDACEEISAKDFAEVKVLRAVSQGELRSYDEEVADLIQDLLPSSNRSSPLGELRSFQEEISELAVDLHAQEPEPQV